MPTLDELLDASSRAIDRFDVEALLQLADELSAIGTDAARAAEQNNRGMAAAIRDQPEKAIKHFRASLVLREQRGEHTLIGGLLTNIGLAYAGQSDYAEALEHFHRARDLHQRFDRKRDLGATVMNIGLVHNHVGDYIQAVSHMNEARDIFETIENRQLSALVYSNIGQIYVKLGELSEAEALFKQAAEIHNEEGDTIGVAAVLSHHASLHDTRGEVEKAAEKYRAAIQCYTDMNDDLRADHARIDLASIYLRNGQVEDAESLAQQVDPDQYDDPQIQLTIARFSGMRALHHGDLDTARTAFEEALQMADQLGSDQDLLFAHDALREVAERSEDLDQYVHHNTEHQRLSHEVQGRSATIEVAAALKEGEISKERAARERERDVLFNALPKFIAERILEGETIHGTTYDTASILFIDIAGFTEHASEHSPQQITSLLDQIYERFDAICKEEEITKIKTIGDSYMAVAFVPGEDGQPELATQARLTRAALQMMSCSFSWPNGTPVIFRAGLHTGPIVAGLIGTAQIQFDVWGKTVAVASHLESTGEAARIQASAAFAEASEQSIHDVAVTFTPRGTIDIKGKGPMTTYWLEGA